MLANCFVDSAISTTADETNDMVSIPYANLAGVTSSRLSPRVDAFFVVDQSAFSTRLVQD